MSATYDDYYEPPKQSWQGIGFADGERAPRIRTGERDPISPLLRQLVYKRDRWKCQHCGASPFAGVKVRLSGALHLDHITPWSAGGPDRSDNLRTLCGPCNQARSNFIQSDDGKTAMPIVRVCLPCLTHSYTRPANAFDVYCACRHHECWAIPGWHIL